MVLQVSSRLLSAVAVWGAFPDDRQSWREPGRDRPCIDLGVARPPRDRREGCWCGHAAAAPGVPAASHDSSVLGRQRCQSTWSFVTSSRHEAGHRLGVDWIW